MTADPLSTLKVLPVNADRTDGFTNPFARAGWTTSEWEGLYRFLTVRTDDGASDLAAWLRAPTPSRFVNPISPALVRDVYARHPAVATPVMVAIGVGASERFAVTFLGASKLVRSPVAGWKFSLTLGLAEPAATGWAATGYLHDSVNVVHFHGIVHQMARPGTLSTISLINAWVERFGPTSYLYVLAGFTLEEATELQKTGPGITDQQLRVMAALNGVILPPGI